MDVIVAFCRVVMIAGGAVCVLAFLVIGLATIVGRFSEGVVGIGAWARDRDDRATFIFTAVMALIIVLGLAVSRYAS